MIYSDSFTTDLKAYRDEQADILSELSKYYFKLFITIRCKKDRKQCPRFPRADEFSYTYREDIVRDCLKILCRNLKVGRKQCWWLAIHENSSSSKDSAHVHIALTYHRDMSEDFMTSALERWQKRLSKDYGLDVCFRKHGKTNGDILVQSQDRMKAYMTKLEPFYIDGALGYKPFSKNHFISQNCWNKCPKAKEKITVNEETKVSSKGIEKPQIVAPIVSKNNLSDFLNWGNVILISSFVSVFYMLFKKKCDH